VSYQDAVRFLYSLGNEIKAAKFDLDRITRLTRWLGEPQRAWKSVHVAGTNGKGSTCAMIESGLRAAGMRTGLFTSPHLVEPVERIRIAGQPVTHEQFTEAFQEVHAVAEAMLAGGSIDAHPTYFETVTAMAFQLFRAQQVDIAVVEVGLGGRLDATNVVTPEVAVITPIDYDHEAFLGKSLESIAAEKAGILKPGVPAVVAPQRAEAGAVVEQRARHVGAPLIPVSEWRVEELEVSREGSRFVATQDRSVRVDCPLPGEHQIVNALTAVAAMDVLGLEVEAIEKGLRDARWPGRLELVSRRPDIYLDGAHNPAGARALAAYIVQFHKNRPVWMIYGAMRDKAVEEIAGVLFPLATQLILTAPQQPRAVRPDTVAELSGHDRVCVAKDVAEALAMARAAPDDAVVFITGSLFLVGEARALLVP
jgi:dihydrofolate synthase/folylpolyglutamate synthase